MKLGIFIFREKVSRCDIINNAILIIKNFIFTNFNL